MYSYLQVGGRNSNKDTSSSLWGYIFLWKKYIRAAINDYPDFKVWFKALLNKNNKMIYFIVWNIEQFKKALPLDYHNIIFEITNNDNIQESLRELCQPLAWAMALNSGPKLVQSWSKLGLKLVQRWSKVGKNMIQSLSKVGPKLFKSWSKVGP